MRADLEDTIVALSTSPGPGARAVVRLSGFRTRDVLARLFPGFAPQPRGHFRTISFKLPGLPSPLPADLFYWPEPHSFTGQDVAELHTISSPPLLDLLIAALLGAGARAALPGEFTQRAFLAGKLDLTRAEAVLGVIEAGDRVELKHALAQLAGGVTRPLQGLREDLLNLLADVEAALDFADEDVQFVEQTELLTRITKGLALVTLAQRQLDQRQVADRPFRAALVGAPNAGKSSLFNALLGGSAALVSDEPGTTRDYLMRRLTVGDVELELLDTAGLRPADDAIERTAQDLGGDQARAADLVVFCVEAGRDPGPTSTGFADVLQVATKCDLTPAAPPATSAVTGEGVEDLRRLLAERARARCQPALAPSLSRCRHHVHTCLDHLRRAHAVALFEQPPEILALELRCALDQLGELVGAVYTDDLLDRIFSRFCIGK
jgi:tRNA modification GTPase